MKNYIYTFIIALALSFSAFCFYYLHIQEVSNMETSSVHLVSSDLKTEDEKDELYFPDVAIVEKLSVLISNIFKVF